MQQAGGFLAGLLTGGGAMLAVAAGLLGLRAVVPAPVSGGVDPRHLLFTNPLFMLGIVTLEELFFRSFLVGWVSQRTSVAAGVALSVAVDYLLHDPNGGQTFLTFVNSVLFSLSACLFYLRLGLGAAVGFHYGWNLVQWTLLGFPMYGNAVGRWFVLKPVGAWWLTGASHGPEGSLLTGLVFGAGLLLWLTVLSRRLPMP